MLALHSAYHTDQAKIQRNNFEARGVDTLHPRGTVPDTDGLIF